VGCKFLLCQAQGAANDFRLWRPLHPLEIAAGQRLRVAVGASATPVASGVIGLSVFLEVVVMLILCSPSSWLGLTLVLSNHCELHTQGVQDGVDGCEAWVRARTQGFVQAFPA